MQPPPKFIFFDAGNVLVSFDYDQGFHQIAERPAYYQANKGREDAAVFAKKLLRPS